MDSDDRLERAFARDPRLRKVRDHVLEKLHRPIPQAEAAEVAALTPKYFSVWFKQLTGISFTDWLHDLRIARASELLKAGTLSITRVAFRVGYSNLRTFQRAFHKRTGMTASEYRRRWKSP